MNILFVANRFPYPPYRGDKLKIYNLAIKLHERHDLHLITFIQDKNDYKYTNELMKYFKNIELIYLSKYNSALNCLTNIHSSNPLQVSYFKSNQFEKQLKGYIERNNIDVIHTQHLRMAQYTSNIKNVKKILDLPDAYSLYWKRRSLINRNLPEKILSRFEYSKVLKYEKIINEFDMTLVCSEEDRRHLQNHHDSDNIRILPNGVELSLYNNSEHNYNNDDRIIFTGNMDYYPNIDASVHFAEEILPEVIKKYPDIKFYIVGQNPVKKILNLQSKNIVVTGFIESLSDEYKKSAISVSPIRVGAGTLNKVLESMAMGIPVVSTEVGFEGLGTTNGDGILLAKNKHEFADSVIRLLSDKNYRRHIGERGKKIITENFCWCRVAKKLEEYMSEVTGINQFTDKKFTGKILRKNKIVAAELKENEFSM